MFAELCLLVGVYLLCLLVWYPLTLEIRYQGGKWAILWLPRVCGGYLPAREFKPRSAAKAAKTAKRRVFHGRGRDLLRALRLALKFAHVLKLDFLFIPGYGYFRCIFALTIGDIMRIIYISLMKNTARQRRKQWKGSMRFSP